MLLHPDDLDRIKSAYESDRAMAVAAAPVRDELAKLAKLAAAAADLSPTARFIIGEERLKGIDLHGIGARADEMASGLTSRMKRAGRRTIAQVMGHLPPKARLLLAIIAALSKDIPKPRDCEILAAATEVLEQCGDSPAGLDGVLYRLPRN